MTGNTPDSKLAQLKAKFELRKVQIDAAVLAGGRATRMHGVEKGLVPFHHHTLITPTLVLLAPLATDNEALISCNRTFDEYKTLSSRLCSDKIGGFVGPLAGVHAVLSASAADYIFVLPCDTPFIDEDTIVNIGEAMLQQLDECAKNIRPIALTCHSNRQPLHCCLPKSVLPEIEVALREDRHKLVRLLDELDAIWIEAPNYPALDNINTPEELEKAHNKSRA